MRTHLITSHKTINQSSIHHYFTVNSNIQSINQSKNQISNKNWTLFVLKKHSRFSFLRGNICEKSKFSNFHSNLHFSTGTTLTDCDFQVKEWVNCKQISYFHKIRFTEQNFRQKWRMNFKNMIKKFHLWRIANKNNSDE